MKKGFYTLGFTTLITGAILTGCNSPSQKVEAARDNVVRTKEDLTKAQDDYSTDVEKFRLESAEKIAANKRSITDFNARIANEKNQVKADYKRKIEVLEQKNTDMKKRVDDYKADGKDKWESFKAEFNHDMDELGHSLKDLTVDNKK